MRKLRSVKNYIGMNFLDINVFFDTAPARDVLL
jgi:hypothetical protein